MTGLAAVKFLWFNTEQPLAPIKWKDYFRVFVQLVQHQIIARYFYLPQRYNESGVFVEAAVVASSLPYFYDGKFD